MSFRSSSATRWLTSLLLLVLTTAPTSLAFVSSTRSTVATTTTTKQLIFDPPRPTAFLLQPTCHHHRLSFLNQELHVHRRDDFEDEERYQEALAHNKLRTDVRMFLTQRALQSFIYLLISVRDPHTVKWLENIYGFSSLENYHGTGALNLTLFDTWDGMFLDLLQRPNDMVIVAARRRGKGNSGGWSSNNPHLEERFVEFEIDIEPASIVSRLLSVRGQIANEWATSDLDTIVAVNELILESYHDTQDRKRNEEESLAEAAAAAAADEDNEDKASESEDNVSIEDLTAPYSGPASISTEGHAYERKAAEYLTNQMMEHEAKTGMPSSPYRKSNFDLLSLLATQEAVHVVLRQYLEQGEERRVSLEWLRNFYTDRIDMYFDGDGKYGRADDFLQDLLLAPPTVVTEDNTMELVDPLRIAEDIIEARSAVAMDWKGIMVNIVPSDHMELQKSILAVRMGKTIVAPTVEVHEEEEGILQRRGDDAFGEFE